MKHIFPRLMGIAFLITAVFLIVGSIRDYAAQHRETDWPTAEATVTDVSSRIERSGTRRRHSSRTVYDITYSYEVDGQTYERQLKGSPQFRLVGDSLTVKYDPDAPESSTTILSPQPIALLIPLLMGFVFGTIGFFASGLSRLLRRGEPDEEEVLPPEEYVTPEAETPPPRRHILQRIIPLFVFAIFLAVNFLLISSGAKAVTAAQFTEAAADHGYVTTDTTEQYREEWRIGSMLEQAVTLEIPGVRIDFCKLDTTSGARTFYSGIELPVSDGTEENSLNREAVTAENDEVFVAKIRVGATVVYVGCHQEDKERTLNILRTIGYWDA